MIFFKNPFLSLKNSDWEIYIDGFKPLISSAWKLLLSLILMQYYGVFLKKRNFFVDKLLIFDWTDVAEFILRNEGLTFKSGNAIGL